MLRLVTASLRRLVHFEQTIHVAHRLNRHRAGRRMDYADSPPELIAQAIVDQAGASIAYRPVTVDGAAQAAGMLADLL